MSRIIIFILSCSIAAPLFAMDTAFTTRCEPAAITFLYYGQPVIQVSKTQAATALQTAISQQENQPITIGTEYAVWALKSNELQVHLNRDPDRTKAIFSPDICGILTPAAISYSQAIAIAQSNGGTAAALAVANPNSAFAAASSSNGGFASAFAQSTGGRLSIPVQTDCIYIIEEGDTLFSIAMTYNTTPEALAAANNIEDPAAIHAGNPLNVPCGSESPGSPPAYTDIPAQPEQEPYSEREYPPCVGSTTYTIQEGDTLYNISVRYGTPIVVIAAANGIDDPTRIVIGQTITIPCEV